MERQKPPLTIEDLKRALKGLDDGIEKIKRVFKIKPKKEDNQPPSKKGKDQEPSTPQE